MLLTAAVSAQQGAPVPVDQEISLTEVLKLVDPRHAGLEDFAAAMAVNDLPRAQQALIKHFAERTKPVIPPASFPGVGEGNSTIVLGNASPEQAEQWLKHTFTESNNDLGKLETYDLGPELRWTQNPSKALSWVLYLNQLNHLNSRAASLLRRALPGYARRMGGDHGQDAAGHGLADHAGG